VAAEWAVEVELWAPDPLPAAAGLGSVDVSQDRHLVCQDAHDRAILDQGSTCLAAPGPAEVVHALALVGFVDRSDLDSSFLLDSMHLEDQYTTDHVLADDGRYGHSLRP
jgi:hypothetical protein